MEPILGGGDQPKNRLSLVEELKSGGHYQGAGREGVEPAGGRNSGACVPPVWGYPGRCMDTPPQAWRQSGCSS